MDRSERKIKQTVSHNAETADRDRVKNKETSDYTRKYAARLARSSFTFGNLFAVKIIGAEERKVKRVFRGEESAALSETSTYRTWIKKSRYMVDAAQGTIPVTPTTVWLYKKYNICERGCQDRGRQKEIPDTYGKHAAPLARSSSVFGDFKKAESGPVQGATVNRRLVEPTNSASMDILYTSLGIVKKRLHLKKTRNENRKGEWLFLALLPIPQVPCQKMLYTATAGTVKENLPVILRRRISALQLPTPIY